MSGMSLIPAQSPSPASVITDSNLVTSNSIHCELSAASGKLLGLETRRNELQNLFNQGLYENEDGLVMPIGDSKKFEIEMRGRIMDAGFSVEWAQSVVKESEMKLYNIAKERAQRSGVVLAAPP